MLKLLEEMVDLTFTSDVIPFAVNALASHLSSLIRFTYEAYKRAVGPLTARKDVEEKQNDAFTHSPAS
jgi:hypothetical protein